MSEMNHCGVLVLVLDLNLGKHAHCIVHEKQNPISLVARLSAILTPR